VRGDGVQGGYEGRGRIHWLSWSMLLILIGAVSLANVRWRRPEPSGASRESGALGRYGGQEGRLNAP
jgi:hypothetical protein